MIKYTIALTLIAIITGIISGILAARVDLTIIEENFPLIFISLVLVNIGLISLAIKRAKI